MGRIRTFGRRPVVSLSRGNEGNPAGGTIRRAKGFPWFKGEAFYLLMAGHKVIKRPELRHERVDGPEPVEGQPKCPERGFFIGIQSPTSKVQSKDKTGRMRIHLRQCLHCV